MQFNADGTADIHPAAVAPAEMETNRLPDSGEDYFVTFAFSGRENGLFDKRLVLPDIENVQQDQK